MHVDVKQTFFKLLVSNISCYYESFYKNCKVTETNNNTYERPTKKQLNPNELLNLAMKAIDSNMYKDDKLCSIAASVGKSHTPKKLQMACILHNTCFTKN